MERANMFLLVLALALRVSLMFYGEIPSMRVFSMSGSLDSSMYWREGSMFLRRGEYQGATSVGLFPAFLLQIAAWLDDCGIGFLALDCVLCLCASLLISKPLVLFITMFNPLFIISALNASLSTIHFLLLFLAFICCRYQQLFFLIICISLLTCIYPPYVVLGIALLCKRFPYLFVQGVAIILCSIGLLYFYVDPHLMSIYRTVMLQSGGANISPSLGVQWYMFQLLFPQFGPIFHYALIMMPPICGIPLVLKIKHVDSALEVALAVLYCLVVICKPYVVMQDVAFAILLCYLASPVAFGTMPLQFLITGIFTIAVPLAHAFYWAWLSQQVANANFFFFAAVASNIAFVVFIVQYSTRIITLHREKLKMD